MSRLTFGAAFLGLVLSGAIFGFFYAWVCSTMWGLDATDPRVAIAAMQAMNASVRNAIFAPAFFGTGPVLLLAGVFAFRSQNRSAAKWFVSGGLLYTLGGMVLTMVVNVPMNEALGALIVPEDIASAREIWSDYSGRWQIFNQIRTLVSGVVLILVGIGIFELARK